MLYTTIKIADGAINKCKVADNAYHHFKKLLMDRSQWQSFGPDVIFGSRGSPEPDPAGGWIYSGT
jgi:hypothetical protein